MDTRGVFISLEGIDGSGKSTLARSLVDALAQKHQVLGLREPGGTVISEKIREMLLDVRNDGIIGKAEAMLYAAARCQLVEEVIRPGLDRGTIIIADRYLDSTVAYQGYGRGLDLGFLEDLNRLCTGGLKPDLTLLLDLDPQEALLRRSEEIPDRLEQEGLAFQIRIREGYLDLWDKEPERIKRLDATHSPEFLLQEALLLVEKLLAE
ncbi:MAG: dTMP kinase [Syntrophomonadaceae bacterium]|nr:dTMP kinase [Syntrophomonadaceae bacterium]